MVDDIGSRVAEGSRGVIAEGEDAGIADFLRQEVFQPKRVRRGMCPSLDGVAA